jgi:hypothetical protein
MTKTWLDRIPYTPLLHLVALLATVATAVADFVITLRNMSVNQGNWDKWHDFLPWLFLWAGGQFGIKRATAWKDATLVTPTSDVSDVTPDVADDVATPTTPLLASRERRRHGRRPTATRSEVGKPPEAGQPALPADIADATDMVDVSSSTTSTTYEAP